MELGAELPAENDWTGGGSVACARGWQVLGVLGAGDVVRGCEDAKIEEISGER